HTLYILDEPTTGLHFDDIRKLLTVLQRLADAGNSLVIIEHNLEVIKCSDWIIDLGPEGGDRGGEIIATGTPEEVAMNDASHTGRWLRTVLKHSAPPNRPKRRLRTEKSSTTADSTERPVPPDGKTRKKTSAAKTPAKKEASTAKKPAKKTTKKVEKKPAKKPVEKITKKIAKTSSKKSTPARATSESVGR
ncbi:MAG: hypothetical protein O3A19_03680, partial [Planctomycetota bacterium]|nr:hypothetical protein [Planctomycetota bacterium]